MVDGRRKVLDIGLVSGGRKANVLMDESVVGKVEIVDHGWRSVVEGVLGVFCVFKNRSVITIGREGEGRCIKKRRRRKENMKKEGGEEKSTKKRPLGPGMRAKPSPPRYGDGL